MEFPGIFWFGCCVIRFLLRIVLFGFDIMVVILLVGLVAIMRWVAWWFAWFGFALACGGL